VKYFAYSQKEFVYKYVVMMSDVDQFKHMSFANYLKLMYLASDALLSPVCSEYFLSAYRFQNIGSRMQFKRQTVAGKSIVIKINSTNLGDEQFELLHTFLDEETAELVGLGWQKYCVMECLSGATVGLSNEISLCLKPIEIDPNNLLYKY